MLVAIDSGGNALQQCGDTAVMVEISFAILVLYDTQLCSAAIIMQGNDVWREVYGRGADRYSLCPGGKY